jgi:hypothetical protein
LPFLITLDVFFGLPDPQWIISGDNEEELRRMATTTTSLGKTPDEVCELGYRGFTVIDTTGGADPAPGIVYAPGGSSTNRLMNRRGGAERFKAEPGVFITRSKPAAAIGASRRYRKSSGTAARDVGRGIAPRGEGIKGSRPSAHMFEGAMIDRGWAASSA